MRTMVATPPFRIHSVASSCSWTSVDLIKFGTSFDSRRLPDTAKSQSTQLEEGDWDVQLSGGVLDVTKLKYFSAGEFSQRVRYWDFAATEQKEGVDPDWTAGVLMGVEDGAYQVQDVQRFRVGPAESMRSSKSS